MVLTRKRIYFGAQTRVLRFIGLQNIFPKAKFVWSAYEGSTWLYSSKNNTFSLRRLESLISDISSIHNNDKHIFPMSLSDFHMEVDIYNTLKMNCTKRKKLRNLFISKQIIFSLCNCSAGSCILSFGWSNQISALFTNIIVYKRIHEKIRPANELSNKNLKL